MTMAERWVIGTLPDGKKLHVNMARITAVDRVEIDGEGRTRLFTGRLDFNPTGDLFEFHFQCVEHPEHFVDGRE